MTDTLRRRVVIEVDPYDPEEVGIIRASEHPEIPIRRTVRAIYHQQLEATGELDFHRLEVKDQWYVGEPDEQDPEWSRQSLVIYFNGLWPENWDDGTAFVSSSRSE